MLRRDDAPSASANPADRRASPRVDVLGDIEGHMVPLGLPVRLMEISSGGFRMETSVMFIAGVVHQFRFTLSDGNQVIVAARVMHSYEFRTPGGTIRYVTGLQFADGTAGDALSPAARLFEDVA